MKRPEHDFWCVTCLAILPVLSALLISACIPNQDSIPQDKTSIRNDLELLAGAQILFGHQSVGRDILEGLADLSGGVNVPLRILPVEQLSREGPPAVYHTKIGRNTEPLGKIASYTGLLNEPGGLPVEVALLKFCYEDLGRRGLKDAHVLLEEYAKAVTAIRLARPQLRLIHVTMPLRADPPGWKTPIKRLMNRATEEDEDNKLRNAFNEALRRRFSGEALFDVAEAESTLPSGKRSYFINDSQTVYTLAQAYTTDGGHLNQIGRLTVAAAFVRSIAGVLREGKLTSFGPKAARPD